MWRRASALRPAPRSPPPLSVWRRALALRLVRGRRSRGSDRRARSKRHDLLASRRVHAADILGVFSSVADLGMSADQVEDAKGGGFGQRTAVTDRPDAPRTAALALALRNQPPCARKQILVHLVERRAEADAAGIVVVDEDRRLCRILAVDRDADVVAVAHQHQLLDLLQCEREAGDAEAAVLGRVRPRAEHDAWNLQPV